MKKVGLMASLLLLSLFSINNAWAYYYGGHGGRSHFQFYAGPYWGPSYYSPYPYYPNYYRPVVVVPPAPPVYIQQQQPLPVITPAPVAPLQPAPVAPAAEAADNYWYYCATTKRYYPYVKECLSGWTKVSPRPPGQN